MARASKELDDYDGDIEAAKACEDFAYSDSEKATGDLDDIDSDIESASALGDSISETASAFEAFDISDCEAPRTFEDSSDSETGGEGKKLMNYVRKRWWEEVRNAVKNGADVTFTNKRGESALLVALWCKEVPLDVIRLLIHPKIINRLTTDMTDSPLYIACLMHSPCVIKELFRAGADPKFYRGEFIGGFYDDYDDYDDYNPLSLLELILEHRNDISLDVSLLEELIPDDCNIDMLTLLMKMCSLFEIHPREATEFQRVLRLLLLHTQFSYPLQVYIQEIACGNGSCFAVSNEAGIRRSIRFFAKPGHWFAGTTLSIVVKPMWHWIVQCLIKMGFTITFPPIIQLNPNAQSQQQQQQQPQQEHQVIRDIKAMYAQYKHQEEKEVAKLSDLCCNVIRAHVQRPFRADKFRSLEFRQLKLPEQVVHCLTREDMVPEVFNEIVGYCKSLDRKSI